MEINNNGNKRVVKSNDLGGNFGGQKKKSASPMGVSKNGLKGSELGTSPLHGLKTQNAETTGARLLKDYKERHSP